MNTLKDISISKDKTILDAYKQMDNLDSKLLIVVDNEKFLSLISAGDIQRAIIQNKPLSTSIKDNLRLNIKIATEKDSYDEIKNMMITFRMEFCPVIDHENSIKKVYFWKDIFKEKHQQILNTFKLPVIIMAGGFGTRMKPLTNVIPKPLIPIGDCSILEHIMNSFHDYGCKDFYISVNYKADLIKYYLNEQDLPYQVSYFKEDKPLGTAGSLSLLKDKIHTTFFVSNCDILVNQDYAEVLKYHQENKHDITIIAALKSYEIAYGTLNTVDDGLLDSLSEKPNLNFKINTGMYILNPSTLNEIPEDTFFHITDLIDKIKSKGGRVGVFPISEKSWTDIGNWEEYLKIINVKN
jgi:dTDP-glucose pyrophosphorylase